MCWREASSGTTPPHSRCIATCDATTFDPIVQTPSVSVTTAADVSSHDVSMPSINIQIKGSDPFTAYRFTMNKFRQRLRIRRASDAALGDDGRHVFVRCDIEIGRAHV